MSSRQPYTFLFVVLLTLLAVCLVTGAPSVALAQDDSASAQADAPESGTESATPDEETPAAEAEPPYEFPDLLDNVNALWTCLAAFLVFFMQAGFALVEAGFTRAKNACNIIMKNLMDFSFGSLLFWLVGFGLMFGVNGGMGKIIGTNNFIFDAASEAATATNENSVSFNWAFLIFQTVFCATAATIVSGAMAERTKFISYLIYSVAISAFVYPIYGHWAWGSLFGGASTGWLEDWSFHDFAGSTVVHSVGGWAALAGALVLGPRIGKYTKEGGIIPIPGHSIPLGALGVFILWFGWFGFNPGSTTAVQGGSFASIAVTTNLAAAAGAIGAMFTSWLAFKKPDPSLSLNGALAGLVAITAGCDVMTPAMASLTGLLAGVLVVGAVVFFDKIRIDDPVGAVSVHGVCGAWGTLAVGLFSSDKGLLTGADHGTTQLVAQVVGVGAGFLWSFPVCLVLFLVLKGTIGLRVSKQEEIEGLDINEHGILAYPPVMVADTHAGTGHAMAGS